MTTLWSIVILPAVLLTAVACQQVPASDSSTPADQVTLQSAIQQGLVETKFEAKGGASGDVIILRIRRKVARDLSVTVPAGLVLRNASQSEQDMVIRQLRGETSGEDGYYPVDAATLSDDDWHEYVLEAYCIEAHKDNPSGDSSLSLADSSDPSLLAVIQSLDRVPDASDNVRAVQAAVWVITDNVTVGDLDSVGYSLSSDDLRTAREILEAAGLDPSRYRLFGAY